MDTPEYIPNNEEDEDEDILIQCFDDTHDCADRNLGLLLEDLREMQNEIVQYVSNLNAFSSFSDINHATKAQRMFKEHACRRTEMIRKFLRIKRNLDLYLKVMEVGKTHYWREQRVRNQMLGLHEEGRIYLDTDTDETDETDSEEHQDVPSPPNIQHSRGLFEDNSPAVPKLEVFLTPPPVKSRQDYDEFRYHPENDVSQKVTENSHCHDHSSTSLVKKRKINYDSDYSPPSVDHISV